MLVITIVKLRRGPLTCRDPTQRRSIAEVVLTNGGCIVLFRQTQLTHVLGVLCFRYALTSLSLSVTEYVLTFCSSIPVFLNTLTVALTIAVRASYHPLLA